ncbi:MAG TPA: ATP-binding cassette domain-containing protein [Acidimicrobiales bacterium]|nr:ATP-binding cassette domain-containing protein [Acidimicrobiales bacterium]
MLEVDGLVRKFGDVVALDGLSLHVGPGQVLGFLGPNGSGKTTALRSILGISEPDEGTVRWQGQPIDATVRQRFGYLPEERGLYGGMKIGEQLTYIGRLHGASRSAAGAASAAWLDRLGLAHRIDDRLDELSLGNQQRVQLAAAFVHDPELLVLDEPFSGLDPISIENVGAILREAASRGVAVIFSSHQLDLVEDYCETAAIASAGRVVASGTLDELRRGGVPRLVVEVVGDRAGAWAVAMEGVAVSENENGRLRLMLEGGTDPQAVLAAAQRAGAIAHFSFEQRRLSEVFREAVSS